MTAMGFGGVFIGVSGNLTEVMVHRIADDKRFLNDPDPERRDAIAY